MATPGVLAPLRLRWGRPVPARVADLVRPENLLPLSLLTVTAWLIVYPVAMVLFGSVRNAAPGQGGVFTLVNWRSVLGDPETFRVLANSLLIAVPRTLLALALATGFAWCVARTNTPCPRLLEGLLAFMFFLPELPWVLAWMLLGAPNVGLLDPWTHMIVPGVQNAITVYSYSR